MIVLLILALEPSKLIFEFTVPSKFVSRWTPTAIQGVYWGCCTRVALPIRFFLVKIRRIAVLIILS